MSMKHLSRRVTRRCSACMVEALPAASILTLCRTIHGTASGSAATDDPFSSWNGADMHAMLYGSSLPSASSSHEPTGFHEVTAKYDDNSKPTAAGCVPEAVTQLVYSGRLTLHSAAQCSRGMVQAIVSHNDGLHGSLRAFSRREVSTSAFNCLEPVRVACTSSQVTSLSLDELLDACECSSHALSLIALVTPGDTDGNSSVLEASTMVQHMIGVLTRRSLDRHHDDAGAEHFCLNHQAAAAWAVLLFAATKWPNVLRPLIWSSHSNDGGATLSHGGALQGLILRLREESSPSAGALAQMLELSSDLARDALSAEQHNSVCRSVSRRLLDAKRWLDQLTRDLNHSDPSVLSPIAAYFGVSLSTACRVWACNLSKLGDCHTDEDRAVAVQLTTTWITSIRSYPTLSSFVLSSETLSQMIQNVPLYQCYVLECSDASYGVSEVMRRKGSESILKLFLRLALHRPRDPLGLYSLVDTIADGLTQQMPRSAARMSRTRLLRSIQEHYGDWSLTNLDHRQPEAQLVDRSLRAPNTWHSALECINLKLKEPTVLTSGDVEPVDWREAALPSAIRLCAEAGKDRVALALFDEYRSLIEAVAISGGSYPKRALSVEAAFGISVALRDTNRWYRAIDVVDVLSQCAAMTTASSHHSEMTRRWLRRSLENVAVTLRHRWQESLVLLAMVRPLHVGPSKQNSISVRLTDSDGLRDHACYETVRAQALNSVAETLIHKGRSGCDWRTALVDCGASHLLTLFDGSSLETRLLSAREAVASARQVSAQGYVNLANKATLRLVAFLFPDEVCQVLVPHLVAAVRREGAVPMHSTLGSVTHTLLQDWSTQGLIDVCVTVATNLSQEMRPNEHRAEMERSLAVAGWETAAAAMQFWFRRWHGLMQHGNYSLPAESHHHDRYAEVEGHFAALVENHVPPALLLHHRGILQKLLRSATENYGGSTLRILSNRLATLLSEPRHMTAAAAEYHDAALLLSGTEGNTMYTLKSGESCTSQVAAVFTEKQLVHMVATSPMAAKALGRSGDHDRPNQPENKQRRGSRCVAFRWTSRELAALRGQHNDSAESYILRELNLPLHQLHAKDLAQIRRNAGQQRIVPGTILRVFSSSSPSPHHDAASLLTEANLTVVFKRRWDGETDDFAVLLKPPGMEGAAMAACINGTPLTHMQHACSGLQVVVPAGRAAKALFALRMHVILGLRRIIPFHEAKPIAMCQFFSKFRMSVLHIVEQGSLLRSCEVVVVEAVCESNETHGAPGTLYELSRDLAIEGWGYGGDSGNRFAERALEKQAMLSSASNDSEAFGDSDAVLDHRGWFFLREVTVRTTAARRRSVPKDSVTEGDQSMDDDGNATVHVEIPLPRWWVQDGLLPPSADFS